MQKINYITTVILAALFIFHFGVLALHHLPNNPIKHQFKYEIIGYINPYFLQEWKLFAPNPASSNMSIMYQYYSHRGGTLNDSTEWLDVNEPLIAHKTTNFWSPAQRILKYLSATNSNIVEARADALELAVKIDTVKNDPEAMNRFVEKWVTSTSGHHSLMEYGKFVYRQQFAQNPILQADSVSFRYKIVEARFPRFSKRKEDYYDLSKYEYRELKSKIYPVNF